MDEKVSEELNLGSPKSASESGQLIGGPPSAAAKAAAKEAADKEATSEKDILWAIQKQLTKLDGQVKVIRQVCLVWFVLMVLTIVGAVWFVASANSSNSSNPGNDSCINAILQSDPTPPGC